MNDADEAAEIEFICLNCMSLLIVKAELAGQEIKCPKCGETAMVPVQKPDE